ncbi:MAG: hypothetical protein EB003_13135, partial [Flavobacteriia bacterium]|nr:hypothetical protein [Flavobacteriia bacterium]
FYGAQPGLQTHLTITDFEIGVDRIDVSQLLDANSLLSGDDLNNHILDLITNANIDADGLHIDLSDLMSSNNQIGASVQLTIQKASITPTGNFESEPTEVTGNDLKAALSEAISTSFETTSALSDAWILDLSPLVYPSAP